MLQSLAPLKLQPYGTIQVRLLLLLLLVPKTDKSYVIHTNVGASSVISLVCGVPQGSVLRPKTFIAYIEEIDSIFSQHGIQHYGYTDDTQAHLAVGRHNAQTLAPRLQNCLKDVVDFCASRWLQLNTNKTEIMWFGSSASLRRLMVSDKNVVIRNVNVQPVDSVWNLGVHLDVHVIKTAQACFFQLRRLARRLLGRDVTANLVAVLVFMQPDYGYALFAGLHYSSVAPYQRVINVAVRLVNGLWPYDHVTQAATDLHCPV